jgi:arabinofuranosyltransferase
MNAWVGDDAYITFRTVDNFVNGYGLTWNTFERVQAYTHPFWMFLHIPIYFIIDNIYLTTMILSFAFSFTALYLLGFKIADNKLLAIAGISTLLLSKVFIDYTSSGLENPLSYFLTALYLVYYFKEMEIKNKLLILSLLVALATLNRMDTVLLFLPSLLFVLIKNWNKKYLLTILLGFTPLILWEMFSILYYGFPFPNTYYAKLNTGIPINEYIGQGFNYYINFFKNDLMAGIVIFVGIIFVAIISIRRKTMNIYIPLLVGLIFYLAYILRIGGDFMSGRFFTVPLFMTVAILLTIKFDLKKKEFKYAIYGTLLTLIILSGFTSYHPVFADTEHGTNNGVALTAEETDKYLRDKNAINDERGLFYPYTSLIKVLSNQDMEPQYVNITQSKLTKVSIHKTIVQSMIGMFGYYAGPEIKIIDFLGLSEPMISRLKAKKNPDWSGKWRIGHFYRNIPLGYVETIDTDNNQIVDENIKEFYNKVKIVTQSDIFSFERFSEIWKMNTGYYNELLVGNYQEDDRPKKYSGDNDSYRVYLHRLGYYYIKKEEYNNGLECYLELFRDTQELLGADNSFFIIYSISKMYYKLGQLVEAEKFSNFGLNYVRTPKERQSYYIMLSKIYEKDKQYFKSYQVLQEFMDNYPPDITIFMELARIYELLGEYEYAMNIYQQAISLKPNHESLKIFYNKIYDNYNARKMYDSAAYYADLLTKIGGKIEKSNLDSLE